MAFYRSTVSLTEPTEAPEKKLPFLIQSASLNWLKKPPSEMAVS